MPSRRALLLALAILILSSGQIAAEQAIIDRLNPGAYARVNHAGELVVSATSGALNIVHISSALHIAGFVPVWAYQSGAWTLAAVHQAGVWNVAHLSAIAHVSLGTQAVYVTQSGAWTIQAAHQGGEWNVRHVGGVLHISVIDLPRWAHLAAAQSGSWTVQAAHLAGVPSISQGAQWSVLAHAQQSGSWTVQAAHQGGEWNIRHVGGVLHVSVIDLPRWAHIAVAQSGPWSVQAAHQGGAPWTVSHISSAVHIAGTAIGGIVQTREQHVASVTHVSGGVFLRDPAIATAARVSHAGALIVNCETGCAGGSSDAVNVFHQSTIRHISSVTHIAVALKPGSNHLLAEVTGPHLSGGIHVNGISNIGSGNAGTSTSPMICHSTLAWHLTGLNTARALIHLTSTNNGIDQGTWRIFICGFTLWTNIGSGVNNTLATAYYHRQAMYSITEGSGGSCGTGPKALMGQDSNPNIPLPGYHSVLSFISPFPWLSTQGVGNELCIRANMTNAAALVGGTITYRAGP